MNLLFAVLSCVLFASDDYCSAYLDHLLIAYREYGLPLPPPEAKLVRYVSKPMVVRRDGKQVAEPGSPDVAFSLDGRTVLDRWNHSDAVASVTPVKPDLSAIGSDVDIGWIGFAIACQDRGWKPLALAAFRRSAIRTGHWDTEENLADAAWPYWCDRIRSDPTTPLSTITKYLKRVCNSRYFEPEIVRSLELSLKPSKALPGSDEALIDDLIEIKGAEHEWDEGFRRDPRYLAIVSRGFAAIPALLGHLEDERLSRVWYFGGNWNCRVKHLVQDILQQLAGSSFEPRGHTSETRNEAITKWFADASKIGEERYVVSRVFGQNENDPRFSPVLFHILTQKYPDRLPDVYRDLIENCPELRRQSWRFAQAIGRSQLAVNVKLKILEYAARLDVPEHCTAGIHFLREIDPKQAHWLLLTALEKLPTSPSFEEATLAWLVSQNADPVEWQALAKVVRVADIGSRLELLAAVARNRSSEGRKQRLAFLESHLTDDASEHFQCRNAAGWVFDCIEVRNLVAMELAEMLKLDADTRPDWTAAQWAELRKRVRAALATELRR
ncbi:MAG: hypothetical protein K8U57_07740 [Planctomycetes bacterium]|nr:hypothetical protein [Planctomycetota bacterium]